jgi:hypothetical protein
MRRSVASGLRSIAARWPDLRSEATEEPVFVLAAAWRSGSTLLQRMLLKHCLVWGEPYGSSGLLERLSQPLGRFGPDWPRPEFFITDPSWEGNLATKWAANMYPTVEHLLQAHLAFFRRLLGYPAHLQGYSRWGLKEVRYGIDIALYLRWLFPRARFLLLVRDPYACWASYRNRGFSALRWWPEDTVNTPEHYGSIWRELARDFTERAGEVGAVLVRYEQLAAPDFDPRPLQDYVGFELDLSARDYREPPRGPGRPATAEEMERLERVVGELAGRLGYRRPTTLP